VLMFSDSRQLEARTESFNSARLRSASPRAPGRQPAAGTRQGVDLRPEFHILHEGIEVFTEDLGGLHQCHLRVHRAFVQISRISLVVVGLLADARLFDFVADAESRGCTRHRWNEPISCSPRCVRWPDVAATVLHDHFHHEGNIVGERRQHVHLLMISTSASVARRAGDQPRLILFHGDHPCRFAMILHHERFDVQHDVRDVLGTPGSCEFVLRTAES